MSFHTCTYERMCRIASLARRTKTEEREEDQKTLENLEELAVRHLAVSVCHGVLVDVFGSGDGVLDVTAGSFQGANMNNFVHRLWAIQITIC